MKTQKYIVILMTVLSVGWVHAQEKHLGTMVEESGNDWIIGQWEATTENGDAMLQSFSWDLDKNVIVSHSKNPRWEIKGMTGINPENGKASYVGFSNRGGAIRGVWGDRDGHPFLRLQAGGQDGRTWKGAVLYRKVDATAMEVQVFGLSEDGEVEESAQSTVVFKRRK